MASVSDHKNARRAEQVVEKLTGQGEDPSTPTACMHVSPDYIKR